GEPIGLPLAILDPYPGTTDWCDGDIRLALHIVGDGLARLLARRLLGGSGIDGDSQARITAARVPGVLPRAPILAETCGQLRNVHAAQADEDRQAHAADAGKRLGRRRRHPDRRMRALEGAWGHRHIREAIEAAVVAERLAFPGLQDDLQRFEE